MKTTTHTAIVSLALAVTLAAPWQVLRAQRSERLPAGIDGRKRTALRGSRNPRIEGLVSDGPVEDSMRGFRLPRRTVRLLPSIPAGRRSERCARSTCQGAASVTVKARKTIAV